MVLQLSWAITWLSWLGDGVSLFRYNNHKKSAASATKGDNSKANGVDGASNLMPTI
jgi:hypothetical protein